MCWLIGICHYLSNYLALLLKNHDILFSVKYFMPSTAISMLECLKSRKFSKFFMIDGPVANELNIHFLEKGVLVIVAY